MKLRGNVEANEAPYDADELVETRTSNSIIRHCSGILQHLAPSDAEISPTVPPLHDSGMTAVDLQELIVALRNGYSTTKPEFSESNNTIDKRWSVNHSTLMKYNPSALESELAPIFQAITSGSRKMECAILQYIHDGLFHTAAIATNALLVITKYLANTIVNLVLWSGNIDRLDEGFHAFCTIYSITAKAYQDFSNLHTYYFLSNNEIIKLKEVCFFQLVLK